MRTPAIIAFDGQPREELLRDDHGRRVLRSWLAQRLVVGLLGLAMPALLILGDVVVLAGGPSTRESLSAYYHSGMRDAFVGILCVLGVFLVTYRVHERGPENWLTTAAGLGAVGAAVFPTWTDRGQPLTPWQAQLGEPVSARIHLAAAAVFIVGLALMSLRFAHLDGRRGHARCALVHRLCGWSMLAALAALAVLAVAGVEDVAGYAPPLLAELVCTVAFGVSWLLKGEELRRAVRAAEDAGRAAPAALQRG